jgi:hypothetical protein
MGEGTEGKDAGPAAARPSIAPRTVPPHSSGRRPAEGRRPSHRAARSPVPVVLRFEWRKATRSSAGFPYEIWIDAAFQLPLAWEFPGTDPSERVQAPRCPRPSPRTGTLAHPNSPTTHGGPIHDETWRTPPGRSDGQLLEPVRHDSHRSSFDDCPRMRGGRAAVCYATAETTRRERRPPGKSANVVGHPGKRSPRAVSAVPRHPGGDEALRLRG